MASINTVGKSPLVTAEGAPARHINPEQQLRRSVMSCLLWENEFYEDGETIAERIASLVKQVSPNKVAQIAIEAREKQNLRHVPLLLVRCMAKYGYKNTASTLERVIQRPDELTEFVALYWKDGKQPLSKQVKMGLAKAFTKFNEYSLQKYNRDGAVKLRDVLFLCHAKPKDDGQAAVWKRLVNKELAIPDTWETNLSAGGDKKETFERLMIEKKLGGLALLRNLRNMRDAGVDLQIIKQSIDEMETDRILPFRFVAASTFIPSLESAVESAMLRSLSVSSKLRGSTMLLVDVSGSMDAPISKKSDLSSMQAGCALAILAREVCESVRIFTFSDSLVRFLTGEVSHCRKPC